MSITSLTTKIKNALNGKGVPSPMGTLAQTFKLGDLLQSLIDQVNTPTVDVIAEATAAAGVTIDGVLLKDSQVTTDQINEKTPAAGVTLDGVKLKDSQVTTDQINEKTPAAGVTLDGVLLKDSQVTTDQINEKTATAGVTVDGCLIKDGRVAGLATASIFLSAEQTGTGSSQNVAHGFAATPAVAIVTFSELDGNVADVAYGAHDATNVVVTVTSGQKFHVLALK